MAYIVLTVVAAAITVNITLFSNANAATVEIPIFQKMSGIETTNVDMPTGTEEFEYPDGQATVEILYKGNQVTIDVDEYNECVDGKEQGIKTLAESVTGGSAALPAMRADTMAGCIDLNSGNK